MKIEKIYPETLKQLMLEVLRTSSDFQFISGTQPFLMKFKEVEYYVYVKNLSSAYFKDRPDTTRAQLPIRDEFDEIKKSPNPFVFFGYDQKNDVLVCWNFHIAKSRLNEKKSVSFYSRQFFQDEVVFGEFLRKKLKNNDEPILFKRWDLVSFFEQIDSFFPLENESPKPKNTIVKSNKLEKITDQKIINQLLPLIKENRTLTAMQLVAEFYKNKYPEMQLRDWRNLILKLSKSIS